MQREGSGMLNHGRDYPGPDQHYLQGETKWMMIYGDVQNTLRTNSMMRVGTQDNVTRDGWLARAILEP